MYQLYLRQLDRGIELYATARTSTPASPTGGAGLYQPSQNAVQSKLDIRTDQPDDDPQMHSAEWAAGSDDPEIIINALQARPLSMELQLPKNSKSTKH